jgi:hypothetical protein
LSNVFDALFSTFVFVSPLLGVFEQAENRTIATSDSMATLQNSSVSIFALLIINSSRRLMYGFSARRVRNKHAEQAPPPGLYS